MECRANKMGSASAWARFFMGFGRRCRKRLGVAIVFLALAPFAPAAGPSRTKSSLPSSPLRTFLMNAVKGNTLLGGALGFYPVLAGSSCQAFVRSLARAFIRAAVMLVASLAVAPAPPSEVRFAPAVGPPRTNSLSSSSPFKTSSTNVLRVNPLLADATLLCQ